MSNWPKYNPDRHFEWAEDTVVSIECIQCDRNCRPDNPCRCCETARADAAEAENAELRATIQRVRELMHGPPYTYVHTALLHHALDGAQ